MDPVQAIIALLTLTAMEIVLGIDNVVFIAILCGRLPADRQKLGRRLGLVAALVTRIMLLGLLYWMVNDDGVFAGGLFSLTDLGIPESWLMVADPHAPDGPEVLSTAVNEISLKDLILFAGGLFLIGKSVHEVHDAIDGEQIDHDTSKPVSFASVMIQVALLDIVFSLDSVITAVGMAKDIEVMVAAIIIAVGVMLFCADAISGFIEEHPTVKMLALSFLILIGVMLTAEAMGMHIKKGYIYFAMAFALFVEVLNMRNRQRRSAKEGAVAADVEVV